MQLLKPREQQSHLDTKPAACSAPASLLGSLWPMAQVSELEVPWHVFVIWSMLRDRKSWITKGLKPEDIESISLAKLIITWWLFWQQNRVWPIETIRDGGLKQPGLQGGHFLVIKHVDSHIYQTSNKAISPGRWRYYWVFLNATSGRHAHFFHHWPHWEQDRSTAKWMIENHNDCCNHMTLVVVTSWI